MLCTSHPELNSKRYASGRCPACHSLSSKKYREAHAAKVKAYNDSYRAKNADAVIAAHREYNEVSKVDINARGKTYKKENAVKVKVARASYKKRKAAEISKKSKEYRLANKAKIAASAVDYGNRNPHVLNANTARRRATKLQATPKWANLFFILEAYALAKLRNKLLGGKWHVDHIVPLRSKLVCGLHNEHNLQVIPASINQTKGNRHWPDMPLC